MSLLHSPLTWARPSSSSRDLFSHPLSPAPPPHHAARILLPPRPPHPAPLSPPSLPLPLLPPLSLPPWLPSPAARQWPARPSPGIGGCSLPGCSLRSWSRQHRSSARPLKGPGRPGDPAGFTNRGQRSEGSGSEVSPHSPSHHGSWLLGVEELRLGGALWKVGARRGGGGREWILVLLWEPETVRPGGLCPEPLGVG